MFELISFYTRFSPLISNLFFQITYLHFSTNKKDTHLFINLTRTNSRTTNTSLLVFFFSFHWSVNMSWFLKYFFVVFSQIASVNYKNTPQNRKKNEQKKKEQKKRPEKKRNIKITGQNSEHSRTEKRNGRKKNASTKYFCYSD